MISNRPRIACLLWILLSTQSWGGDPEVWVTTTGEAPRVGFGTVTGRSYAVEANDGLTNDAWEQVGGTVPGDGAIHWIGDEGATGKARRFYRVRHWAPAPPGMVLVPAGSFSMGDTSESQSDEAPVHVVSVSAFHLDVREVTKALWDEVATWAASNGYDITAASGLGKGADHPVYSITWWEAVKFCNARSQKEGLTPCYTNPVGGTVFKSGTTEPVCDFTSNGYRLPTEAEWEKAARGGLQENRFPWGDTISHSQANYFSTTDRSYDVSPTREYHPTYNDGIRPYTAPAGSFAATGDGHHDLTGNLAEWCWDWYSSFYYSSSPATDPRGPRVGSQRVHRGGHWSLNAQNCRVAKRAKSIPSHFEDTLGFRTARTIVP